MLSQTEGKRWVVLICQGDYVLVAWEKERKSLESSWDTGVGARPEEWDAHGNFLSVLNVALSGYGIETSEA